MQSLFLYLACQKKVSTLLYTTLMKLSVFRFNFLMRFILQLNSANQPAHQNIICWEQLLPGALRLNLNINSSEPWNQNNESDGGSVFTMSAGPLVSFRLYTRRKTPLRVTVIGTCTGLLGSRSERSHDFYWQCVLPRVVSYKEFISRSSFFTFPPFLIFVFVISYQL